MPRKNPPTGTDADLNTVSMQPLFADEDKAREFFESRRWPNGPVCPHCKATGVYKLTAKPGSKNPVPPGVYKCAKCRKKFTVRVGTIFEDSKLPLRHWLHAFHLMAASKKGISSHQIARVLGITVKSAWFLTHRIREAMKHDPMPGILKGELEADETYVGARKPRYKGTSKAGRGTSKKAVAVLVERGGRAHATPVDAVDGKTLRETLFHYADRDSTLFTDELPVYHRIGREFSGGHHRSLHKQQEYVRKTPNGDMLVTTNTAESFFSLLKRGHYGTFHQLGKRHLHRNVNEFSFRWNHRALSDGERMVAAIKGADGKRLMYRQPMLLRGEEQQLWGGRQ
jgi:transposase-like protein